MQLKEYIDDTEDFINIQLVSQIRFGKDRSVLSRVLGCIIFNRVKERLILLDFQNKCPQNYRMPLF